MKNYYALVLISKESDVLALYKAAELAKVMGRSDYVELHECGTKKLIARVDWDGNINLNTKT